MDDRDPVMGLVHLLRAVTVEFDLLGAEFAARRGLHPTDVRALIHLLDAARADIRATPGWLGEQLRLNSAGTTALVDRLERLGWAFFGPLIDEVVAAAEGLDEGELETVRRFLTSVLTAVARARDA